MCDCIEWGVFIYMMASVRARDIVPLFLPIIIGEIGFIPSMSRFGPLLWRHCGVMLFLIFRPTKSSRIVKGYVAPLIRSLVCGSLPPWLSPPLISPMIRLILPLLLLLQVPPLWLW
jgi:hypothetical protein